MKKMRQAERTVAAVAAAAAAAVLLFVLVGWCLVQSQWSDSQLSPLLHYRLAVLNEQRRECGVGSHAMQLKWG